MYYGGKHLTDPQEPFKLVDLRTLSDPSQEQTSLGIDVRVDNLSFFVSDQYLREMFSAYGYISFCKVTRKPDLSNGSGRVTFSNHIEAKEAIAAMHGQYIRSSQIQVSLEGGEKGSGLKIAAMKEYGLSGLQCSRAMEEYGLSSSSLQCMMYMDYDG